MAIVKGTVVSISFNGETFAAKLPEGINYTMTCNETNEIAPEDLPQLPQPLEWTLEFKAKTKEQIITLLDLCSTEHDGKVN